MTTRVQFGRVVASALLGGAMCVALASEPAQGQCVGDCNGNGSVAINELILGVSIALGNNVCTACQAFCNAGGTVPITRLIQGVNNALGECDPVDPTPTSTGVVDSTPTATPTVTPSDTPGGPCPVTPGKYTLTQVAGGSLKVGALPAFPFPAGGSIVQDVGPGTPGDCVHDVTVKFPGGLTTPNFCIPALRYVVSVTQTGCGVGKLDSNGGSDFTINEVGDTSDSSEVCDIPNASCAVGNDSEVRVDLTVGDGTPDTCTSGTGNAIVSIPVFTRTWGDMSEGNVLPPCPGNGVFDEGVDLVIVQFPQTLDFTTDTNTAVWDDIDGDGCEIAGGGPPEGIPGGTGTCLNLDDNTISTAASGTIGSKGAPLYDITFLTLLPNVMTGPEPAESTTCDTPPIINFDGTATRCIEEEAPAACPIAAGSYTMTQVEGGALTVNGFAAFPFPAGGSIVQDVSAATMPDCIHDTVVPFPDGFSAPNFCIPALGFVTSITQTGCGVGQIDSNGGSDYTVNEIGDTSDASATCNLPHANSCANGADSSQRVDITVGDGTADTCAGTGTVNAIVSIPVFTKTWLDTTAGPQVLPPCNGDGVNQPTDLLITQFPQILDFTTDSNTAKWQDIDSDGCFIAGAGPAAGFSGSGECLDVEAGTVKTAAAGTIGSNGAPTFDLSFLSVLPNTISAPGAPLGVTCAEPPAVNFTGSATRCLQ